MTDPNNVILEIDISCYKSNMRYQWSLYNHNGSSKYTNSLHTEYGPFSLVGTLYGKV
jgi:hypothetical protein